MDTEKLKEYFVGAFQASGGNVSDACKAVKISRVTYYRWRKDDEKFKESCDEVNEMSIDNVESVLYKEALGGNIGAICFFLKTRAKHRGYTERTEFTVPDLSNGFKVEISNMPPENEEPTDDEI